MSVTLIWSNTSAGVQRSGVKGPRRSWFCSSGYRQRSLTEWVFGPVFFFGVLYYFPSLFLSFTCLTTPVSSTCLTSPFLLLFLFHEVLSSYVVSSHSFVLFCSLDVWNVPVATCPVVMAGTPHFRQRLQLTRLFQGSCIITGSDGEL